MWHSHTAFTYNLAPPLVRCSALLKHLLIAYDRIVYPLMPHAIRQNSFLKYPPAKFLGPVKKIKPRPPGTSRLASFPEFGQTNRQTCTQQMLELERTPCVAH